MREKILKASPVFISAHLLSIFSILTRAARAQEASPSKPPHTIFEEFSLNGWWLVLLIVVCGLWLFIADRVNRAADRLKMAKTFWNLVVFVLGAAGLSLSWFVDARYYFATVGALLLFGLIFAAARDRRVAENERVLSREYARQRLIALLGAVGIRVNPRTFLRRRVPGKEVEFLDVRGNPVDVAKLTEGVVRGAEAMTCVREMMDTAIRLGAPAFTLQPKGETVKVRFEVDGVLHEKFSYPWELGNPAGNFIKQMAGIDPKDRFRQQRGRLTVVRGKNRINALVYTTLSVQGETLTVRFLRPRPFIALEKLGMDEATVAKVKELLKQEKGLILLAAPSGSGRTTTLLAMLHAAGSNGRPTTIIARERLSLRLDDFQSVTVNIRKGDKFEKAIERAVEEDKDKVIGVDELPDAESVRAAVDAADTHLIIAGIDAPNAIAGIYKLVSMDVGTAKLWGVLRAALAQRLVRVLCGNCKREYIVKPQLLMKLGVKSDSPRKLFRSEGCPACGETGFRGRTGVFEFLEMTGGVRRALQLGKGADAMLLEAKKAGFAGMRRNGLNKVLAGVTSADELNRVLKPAG